MRILVIDDEPAVAAVLAEALHEEGHEVLVASGGEDLLRVGPHRHGGSLGSLGAMATRTRMRKANRIACLWPDARVGRPEGSRRLMTSSGPRARRKGITVAALALCGMTLTAGCVVSSPSSVGGGPSVGCLESLDGEEDRYAPVIDRVAMRYGVHPDLIDSVIRVESAFNPRAVSRKGARGLMQLMPETASLLGVRDAFDPLQNIDGGVRHLRGLLHRYRGKLVLALAAYNAGDRAVDRYRGVPPYRETQHYVKQVLSLYQDQVPRRHLRDRRPATASIPLILPVAHLAPGRQRVPGGARSSC